MRQNELELVLEMDGDFLGRKMDCVGAGISGGGPLWSHGAGGAPSKGGHALDPRGQVLAPPAVFSVPKILKYSIKIILNLQGNWSTFIFEIFFYCMDNSENRQIILFLLLFILNNRK